MSRKRRKDKGSPKRELDPRRWAYAAFAVGGFTAAWVLSHFIEDVWAVVWSYWPTLARPSSFVSNVAGIVIAVIATLLVARHKRWFAFVTEVVVEVSQVTWPSRPEIRAATIVVIVMTLICSAILAGMDSFWSTVTDWLYGA